MDVDGAFRTVNLKHAIVMTGIFGALLASMLAFGEGLARRSLRTVVFGAVLGIVVGGVLGCLAGLLGFLMDDFSKSVDGFFPVARSVCVQGVVLAVLGAAVGLTFGLLTQRMSAALTCLAYGLLGGGLVAMLFPLGVALAVPNLEPGPAIPNHQIVRLLWIAIVSGVLGLLIPERFARKRRVVCHTNRLWREYRRPEQDTFHFGLLRFLVRQSAVQLDPRPSACERRWNFLPPPP